MPRPQDRGDRWWLRQPDASSPGRAARTFDTAARGPYPNGSFMVAKLKNPKPRTRGPAQPAPQWPAGNIEPRPLASVLPYAQNARTHSDAQIVAMAASIKEWGWTMPLLVAEDGELI